MSGNFNNYKFENTQHNNTTTQGPPTVGATVQAVPGSSTQITIQRQGAIGFPECTPQVNNYLRYYGQRIMEFPPHLRPLVDVDVANGLNAHALRRLKYESEQMRLNDQNLVTPHEYNSPAPSPSGNSPLWGAYMEPASSPSTDRNETFNVRPTASSYETTSGWGAPQNLYKHEEEEPLSPLFHPSPENENFNQLNIYNNNHKHDHYNHNHNQNHFHYNNHNHYYDNSVFEDQTIIFNTET